MAGIPRFEAQIGRISVPTMQNFQQEQNEQIYRAVAGVAETSAKIAENMYAQQKKYEATVQGAEDVKRAQEEGKQLNLKELPTPYTQSQAAYNESAINAFASQYTVDTSIALTDLENENRDNPYAFLEKAQAYIDGASSEIPEYLKPSIVKPMEMNARSIYSSLLKKQIEKNKNGMKAAIMVNLDDMSRSAQNEINSVIQDEKIGQIVTLATNAAANQDISPEYARKIITDTRKGIASQRLTNQLLSNNNDPAKITATINMAMSGKTGIEAFDTLSPEERADAIKTALGHISYAKGYLGQVAEQAGKYELNKARLETYDSLNQTTELTDDVLKEISWGNKTLANIMKDDYTGNYQIETNPTLSQDIDVGIEKGNIDEKDIVDAYESGYISGPDAMQKLRAVFSPLSINKKKPAYSTFSENLNNQMGDKKNEIGTTSQINMKKKYIEDNMTQYLSGAERTDEEIMSFATAVEDRASKMFNKENEYSPIYTPAWFREKTGYSITAIENAVNRASVGGQLDMNKLREILLDMTDNDEHQANSIYSMYMAVKNQ